MPKPTAKHYVLKQAKKTQAEGLLPLPLPLHRSVFSPGRVNLVVYGQIPLSYHAMVT